MKPGELFRYRCDAWVFKEDPIDKPNPKIVPEGQLVLVLQIVNAMCYFLTPYGICYNLCMFLEKNVVMVETLA